MPISSGNYMAFPSFSAVMGVEEADTLLEGLNAQDSLAFLPKIYASSPELLAGLEAQRALIASDLSAGTVPVLKAPITAAGASLVALEKPLPRGTVYLNALNPHGVPVVSFNSLSNPFDRTALFRSAQWLRKLMATDAMAIMQPIETRPGPEFQTEDGFIEAMIATGWLKPSFAHPSCSCPMMPRRLGGVVDAELMVYGTRSLSIVDASILPIIPACHLQATMYGVAEKASDIIKGGMDDES